MRDAGRADRELRKRAARGGGRSAAYYGGTLVCALGGGAVLGALAAVLIGRYVYLAVLLGMLLGRVAFQVWWTHPPARPARGDEDEPVGARPGCPTCGFDYKWDGTACGHGRPR